MTTLSADTAGGRLIRFVIVGSVSAALLFALVWLFSALGAAPFLAGAGGYAIAFVFAYTAQRNWTFAGRAAHGTALPRYLAVQLFCAALSGLSAHAASAWLGWPAPAVSAFATGIASAAGFVLSSLWAFAPPAR